MTGYYDYVLGFIPLALLGVSGVLTTVGLEMQTAVALGAGVSFLAVAHALFVNAPVDAGVDEPVPAPTTTSPPSPKPVNAD
jgi:hypothetical protein